LDKVVGLNVFAIGVVLTLTVLSSALYAFIISFMADRIGRKKTLVFFALTDVLAGSLLLISTEWWAPVLAGVVGNMTVGAGEVGPFLTLEQAILPKTCDSSRRTLAFSVYNLSGYAASSLGALLAVLPQYVGYRPLFLGYMASGLLGAVLYLTLSNKVEPERASAGRAALSPSARPIVVKLSALFAVDSFGGGFIGQSILSYYFFLRFGLDLSTLGIVFFVTQIVTAMSFLLAERIARRVGLLRTMVFSHIPSNVFLIAVAFAPTALLAVVLLLCRQSLSQMDVPTRQSYTMAVVDPDERTATAGITNVARTTASAVSPTFAGMAFSAAALSLPFFLAAGLKIVYDALVYLTFRNVHPPEEAELRRRRAAGRGAGRAESAGSGT